MSTPTDALSPQSTRKSVPDMLLKIGTIDAPEVIVSESPTSDFVAATISRVDWSEFSFVTLFIDDDNWLDGSGCMNPLDGLSVMLSVARIQYVCETAPEHPDDFLPYFDVYLSGDLNQLFALIYNAQLHGLSDAQVAERRCKDDLPQRQRLLDETIAATNALFAQKQYDKFIDDLTPYQDLLTPAHLKKLDLARRRQAESGGQ
ncbi:MAG: hypothetical protein AAF394_02830 [Planctomycetota bacterium]